MREFTRSGARDSERCIVYVGAVLRRTQVFSREIFYTQSAVRSFSLQFLQIIPTIFIQNLINSP